MSRSTVEFKGIDLDVDFYFEPGQPEIIRADANASQPGYSAYVEVGKVWLKGVDISPLLEESTVQEIANILEGAAA